ncbi:MAG: hypothetical protein AAB790_01590 [Patescibacteria group bacterium]
MTKPKKPLTDDDVRNILHPVDPEKSTQRLRLGYDYAATSHRDRIWKRYGLNQYGQWTLHSKCKAPTLADLNMVLRHVDLIQSITVPGLEGVGVVESWTWRTQPASGTISMTQRVIDFFSRIASGMPAVG